MKVAVVTLTKNEEFLVPYFLRHYDLLADEIIVFDNQSTDRTRELLLTNPKVQIRDYSTEGIRDDIHMDIKNNAANYTDADWIIVCDFDEFLHPLHVDFRTQLAEYESSGITVAKVKGYQMVGELPFAHDSVGFITDHIRQGVEDDVYSKHLLWHRSAQLRYTPGAHNCYANGTFCESLTVDFLLLHFKFLWKEYAIEKASRNVLSEINKQNGWGIDQADAQRMANQFDSLFSRRTKVL